MKKIFLLLFILLLFTPIALAQEIETSVYILNLGKFDVATGTFTADFYLSMKCDTECNSNFEFMNGRATSIDKIIDEKNEKFYRIQASLNSPVNLKQFPFDKQKMEIIIEDKITPIEDLIYVPKLEESGLDDSIIFIGWDLDGWNAEAKEHYYPAYEETYSQYVFTIDISRPSINAFFKTFLPVIFIVLIALLSFFLDPDKITTRLGMVGSALVASVMFHVSITNQIPPVGYLTFADKFMILTYFVLLASFILNVLMLDLLERKKNELVDKIHKVTEYSMIFIVVILYALLLIFLM
ncbi:hypothetical protein J4405_01975 [Candidatus Woesearchaeota archaeon]|nr:hypothetical protein [Candidatus Woesearchaeota archaeon]